MSLNPGSRLGPYEILSRLGASSLGEVYRARDSRLGRDVAVNVLGKELAGNAGALARFAREAKAVGALNHPNIAGIFDFGSEDRTTYLVMEWIEGESLQRRLESGPLPQNRAVNLGRQMAEGLAAAHDQGVIHRNLKPENIWITKDGQLKILHFGIVEQVPQAPSPCPAPASGGESQTGSGVIPSAAGYMSPEQVRGETVDARSDIFSFGAVFLEMLAGQPPFTRDSVAETMAAILKDDLAVSAKTRRALPAGLMNILCHCLEKSPGLRFQSAHDIGFALESVSATLLSPPLTQRNWRASVKWFALGAFLLAGAGFLGWSLRSRTIAHPTFKQITFRRGNVLRARFMADGENIVYSASWDGRPCEIFTSRVDGSGARALGIPNADLMAVNRLGELLILLKSGQWAASTNASGTLAQVSMEGGIPREIMGRVRGADFAPDGRTMAVIYQDADGGHYHLDYPLGTRILASIPGFIGAPRICPRGDRVAFVYSGTRGGRIGARGGIAVVDRAGNRRDLDVDRQVRDQFLTWSLDGREIYFASTTGMRAVDMNGHVRPVNADSTSPFIHDISAQGWMLLEREHGTNSSIVRSQGGDMDLGWQNQSHLTGFSRDGSLALLYEAGGAEFSRHRPYLRRCDNSPPKVLDSGIPLDLSPEGDYALILHPLEKPKLMIVPTGVGSPREIGMEGWTGNGSGYFSADGKQVFSFARQAGGPLRLLRLPVDGSPGSPLPESIQNIKAFAPDDSGFLCIDTNGQPSLVSPDGGILGALPWKLEPGESVVGWTGIDEALVAHPEDASHLRLDRIKLSTGQRRFWQRLVPPDPTSAVRLFNVRVSRDGSTVGYTVTRVLVSDLIVARGLK